MGDKPKQSWSENFANRKPHPDSPAGGTGPGFSQPTLCEMSASWEKEHEEAYARRLAHPFSLEAIGYHLSNSIAQGSLESNPVLLLCIAERNKAVLDAIDERKISIALLKDLEVEVVELVKGFFEFFKWLLIGTAVGAALGVAVGAAVGGVAAGPAGAVAGGAMLGAAGAELGFDISLWLLTWCGLAFLIESIHETSKAAYVVLEQGVRLAQASVEVPSPADRQALKAAAGDKFAECAVLTFRATLHAMLAVLVAKSAARPMTLPELVGKLSESKFGAPFANWFKQNVERLKAKLDVKGDINGLGDSVAAQIAAKLPPGVQIVTQGPGYVVYRIGGRLRIRFDARAAKTLQEANPGRGYTTDNLAALNKAGEVFVHEGRHRAVGAAKGDTIPPDLGGVPGQRYILDLEFSQNVEGSSGVYVRDLKIDYSEPDVSAAEADRIWNERHGKKR